MASTGGIHCGLADLVSAGSLLAHVRFGVTDVVHFGQTSRSNMDGPSPSFKSRATVIVQVRLHWCTANKVLTYDYSDLQELPRQLDQGQGEGLRPRKVIKKGASLSVSRN